MDLADRHCGGLVLFALGIGVSLLMGVLARVIAPLGHLVVNKVTKESLEFLVLWWFYSTLMQPVSYAFGASVVVTIVTAVTEPILCLLYTSPSPRDLSTSRMPSSA